MTASMDLDGAAVVVTGAGRGIGRGHAVALAAAGARVLVNDVDADEARSVVDEIEASGGQALVSGHSVADPAQCAALIESCVSTYGGIDGLVNNAAIEYEAATVDDDPERQARLITTNVLGSLWCGSAALKHMLAQGRGRIVNTVSGAAVGFPGLAAYGTSKAALLGLTYSWAAETKDTGVRVNAISPVAATRMSRDDVSPPADGIAPIVCWLMHPGSAHVTGQVIRFTGRVLGLMGPPRIAKPVLHSSAFTTESVASAFTDDLDHRLQPFGFDVLVADAAPDTAADSGTGQAT